jgi:3alpha(or 20beta)-hydroxysteroid dehydrogenase
MFSLEDRVAIITGGASGMGLATGRRFAAAGARVVLADRADATTQAADIGATALRLDVSDESAVAAAFDSVAARHGRIDILVNNAGVFVEGAIDDATSEEWRQCWEINALGVLHGIKYSTPHMTPGTSIVNTASVAAVLGFPGYAAYSASKAAVVAITRVAALEYGPRGIRVNCICPGTVDTPMLAAQANREIEAGLVSVASPIGRIIEPDEVAALIHFLVSEDCPVLTGLVVPIEGGMTAGMSIKLTDAVVASLD